MTRMRAPFVLVLLQWLSALVIAGPSATALNVPFLTNTFMGPDGPWNFIESSVDYPAQNLYFYPSLTTSSVIVPNAACQNQSSECPLPLPPLYQQTDAQRMYTAD